MTVVMAVAGVVALRGLRRGGHPVGNSKPRRSGQRLLPGSPVFGNAGDDRQAGDEQDGEGNEYRGLQLAR